MVYDVAVVIPAHNEGRMIGGVVARMKRIFSVVVVVDDGSRDETAQEADRAGAIVLRHHDCRGKGAALRTGFFFALQMRKAAVITMDGDGQHLPEDAVSFIKAWRRRPDIDLWVGRRNMFAPEMPALRRATNIIMSLLISVFALQRVHDTQTGYRLITADLLRGVPLFTSHFQTESEVLIRASWRGFRISSVPIATVYGVEKSKIRAGRDTARFFLLLIALFYFSFRTHKPAYPHAMES